MNKFFILVVLIAVLASAILVFSPQKETPAVKEEIIKFETLSKGIYSGYADPAKMVINQEFVFSDLWQKTNSVYTKIPAEPQIDFEKETVIAVFMGIKNTGGYLIEIEKIVDEPAPPGVRCEAQTRCVGKVVIYMKETKPKPGEMVTEALTQPYNIVKTPKIIKPVEFKKIE